MHKIHNDSSGLVRCSAYTQWALQSPSPITLWEGRPRLLS